MGALVRSLARALSVSLGGKSVVSAAGDPTINTVNLFEGLSLTVTQFESNSETVTQFEAGLLQSEIEDQV
jgi:hypothetical protein